MGRHPADPEEIEKLRRSISTALRPAREARGLTQEQVAELIGIAAEFYARMERGNALPGLANLVKMADALQISVDSMLPPRAQSEPEVEDVSDEIQGIIDRCRADPQVARLVSLLLTASDKPRKKGQK